MDKDKDKTALLVEVVTVDLEVTTDLTDNIYMVVQVVTMVVDMVVHNLKEPQEGKGRPVVEPVHDTVDRGGRSTGRRAPLITWMTGGVSPRAVERLGCGARTWSTWSTFECSLQRLLARGALGVELGRSLVGAGLEHLEQLGTSACMSLIGSYTRYERRLYS